MRDWPSFLDEAGPMPGLSGAADEARDRLVETFVKYIQRVPPPEYSLLEVRKLSLIRA